VKLGQIASIRMGYPFRSRVEHAALGTVTVVQMKDIDDANALHLENAARVHLPDLKEHHLIEEGDLIFRSRGQTNLAAVVWGQVGNTVVAAPLLVIRPERQVLPAYLLWYINHPATQEELSALAEGTSVRMISKAALEELEIPVPGLQRQRQIVELSALAIEEQRLLESIAERRKRLADGVLLRYARNVR
jgi:restriction endonuclease S subunit